MNRLENRLVAFIDVLGLSGALASVEGSARYAKAVDAVLSPIVRNTEEAWLVLRHVQSGEEVEIELSLPVTRRSRITTVSDAILMSVPFGDRLASVERSRRIFDLLKAVHGIQRSLWALGLKTRGGVSMGRLIHKSHLVVGQGLVKAYALESQVAIYPRVVVDDEIIDILVASPMPDMVLFRNRVAHTLRQDADAAFFIDYMNFDPVTPGTRISVEKLKNIINDINRELKDIPSLRVKQKLMWMLRYISTTMSDWGDTAPHRFSHADLRFSHKFYRTDENLKNYVEAMEAKIATSQSDQIVT